MQSITISEVAEILKDKRGIFEYIDLNSFQDTNFYPPMPFKGVELKYDTTKTYAYLIFCNVHEIFEEGNKWAFPIPLNDATFSYDGDKLIIMTINDCKYDIEIEG